MSQALHRRTALRAGLAFGLAALAPRVRACEYVGQNLRVTHPWTRGTAEGARFAVLCMRFDDVRSTDRLIGVRTPVAGRACMGGADEGAAVDLLLFAGSETVLSETGTHIRLEDLTLQLSVGRSYPLSLEFAKGGVIEATLNVDYPDLRFR